MSKLSLVETAVALLIVTAILVLCVGGASDKDRCFKTGGSEYSIKQGCVYKNVK